MKNIFSLVVVLICCSNAFAQQFSGLVSFDYIRIHAEGPEQTSSGYYSGGSTYKTDFPNYEITTIDGGFLNFQAVCSFDYSPLRWMDDKMGLGVGANVGIGYFVTPTFDGLNSALSIDVPQYLMIRYGRNVVKDSDEKFGIGLGVGYNYQIMPLPLGALNVRMEILTAGDLYIRLNADLTKKTLWNLYTSEGLVPAISFKQIGFQFGYLF